MEKNFENHYQKLANQLADCINTKDLGDMLENEFKDLFIKLNNSNSDEGKHYAAVLAEHYLSQVRDFPNKPGAKGRK